MKLFSKIYGLFIAIALTVVGVPVLAQSEDINNLKKSLATTGGQAGLDTKIDLPTAIGRPISYLFGIIAVIFLVMSVTGGFLWMTAGGSEEKVGRAKTFIIGGVNGLIIMFFAYALVYVVLSALGYASGE